MELQKIKKVVVHDAIIKQIKNYIKNNKLKTNAKLPSERKLAESLNVSRNSIREALKSMQSQGYLKIIPGLGTFVISIDILDVEEEIITDTSRLENLLQVREMLDTYSAKLALKKIDKEKMAYLYNLVEEENERHLSGNTKDLPNVNFELEITKITENNLLINMYSNFQLTWRSFWNEKDVLVLPNSVRYKEHMNIIKALEKGDIKKLEKVVLEHIKSIHTLNK